MPVEGAVEPDWPLEHICGRSAPWPRALPRTPLVRTGAVREPVQKQGGEEKRGAPDAGRLWKTRRAGSRGTLIPPKPAPESADGWAVTSGGLKFH